MSGNAALAAARRRRGEEPIVQNNTNQRQPNMNNMNASQMPSLNNVHPLKCVLNHDKQIWILERQIEQIIENINSSDNANNNSFANDQNTNEIKLLKSTIQKQQKNIQELNTLVTSLKATLLNTEHIISDLTDKFDTMNNHDINDYSSKITNTTKGANTTNTNSEKKSSIKLDIAEK